MECILGELSKCKEIESLIDKITKGYQPSYTENVILQAHFRSCKDCCDLYNKKVLKI